jgi:hypothetical protein
MEMHLNSVLVRLGLIRKEGQLLKVYQVGIGARMIMSFRSEY